jgi:hypothetical protein
MTASQREEIRAPQSERKISLDDFLDRCEQAAIEREKITSSGNGSHEALRYCDCAESLLRGKRLPVPKYHSCEYVAQRNALIPKAESIASAHCSPIGKESGYVWTRRFVKALDELAAPLLKQSGNGTRKQKAV